jgi:hypothetical protein
VSEQDLDFEEQAMRVQQEAEARFARVQANFNSRVRRTHDPILSSHIHAPAQQHECCSLTPP